MRSCYNTFAGSSQCMSRESADKRFYIHERIDMEGCCDYFDLGDKAPEFTLPAIVNNEPKDVSLLDYRGKWVVLFFYSSDFTFL